MRKLTAFIVFFIISSCNPKLVKHKPKEADLKEQKSTKIFCTELDSILVHKWKLANAPQASFFHQYERNDTLVNRFIVGKYKNCFLGKTPNEVQEKLGVPTYKSLYLMYYQFLSTEEPSYCLKFWIRADTIYQIKHEPCTAK